jgi:succinylornithine aminotransferase
MLIRAGSALTEQAGKFWHTGNGYTNEPVLRLAKQLIDATLPTGFSSVTPAQRPTKRR